MKNRSEIRIEKMRNGEKIKCPKCAIGYFYAVGDPQTTKIFRCDTCHTTLIQTLPYNKHNDHT